MPDDFASPEEESSGDAWLVSYADLMTLLFAAFVVLYGIKPEGETKEILGVTSSIREAFVEIPDVIPKEEKIGPTKEGSIAFEHFRGEKLEPNIIKKYRRNTKAINIINENFEKLKSLLIDISRPKNTKTNLSHQLIPGISLHREPDGLRLRLAGKYLYDSGKYRIKRQFFPKLKRLGQLLKTLKRPVHIEGHTDNIPLKSGITNWELSIFRASYVLRFFIDEVKIAPELLSASGYADTRPIVSNEFSAGRKTNRRIEVKISYE